MIAVWGFGDVLGPLLISYVVHATGTYTRVLYIIVGIMLVSPSIAVHCSTRKRKLDGTVETEARA